MFIQVSEWIIHRYNIFVRFFFKFYFYYHTCSSSWDVICESLINTIGISGMWGIVTYYKKEVGSYLNYKKELTKEDLVTSSFSTFVAVFCHVCCSNVFFIVCWYAVDSLSSSLSLIWFGGISEYRKRADLYDESKDELYSNRSPPPPWFQFCCDWSAKINGGSDGPYWIVINCWLGPPQSH